MHAGANEPLSMRVMVVYIYMLPKKGQTWNGFQQNLIYICLKCLKFENLGILSRLFTAVYFLVLLFHPECVTQLSFSTRRLAACTQAVIILRSTSYIAIELKCSTFEVVRNSIKSMCSIYFAFVSSLPMSTCLDMRSINFL